MASFDVKSLFTNIPLDETINIICDSMFKDNDTHCNFSKQQFTSLLQLAVKDSPFLFNKCLYVQTDGVAMGSCLGPSLANIFLCHHEANWLDNCPTSFKPLLYRRYVDDTFLLFHKREHIPKFLSYLNSQHPNIEFTSEIEKDLTLPFLDVLLTRDSNRLHTSVYRKNTFTGLGLKYLSFIPELFKINAISTLLYRCYQLSSNWLLFDKEINYLRTFFHNNGFPLDLINRRIHSFLNYKFNVSPTPEHNVRTKKYIKLPFYGHLSYSIRNKLDSVLKHYFPDTKFHFVFTNTLSIGSFFKFKDMVPPDLSSNIIYEFSCPGCKARYIGETKRNLKYRIAEHKGKSVRTNRLLANPPFSSIRQHAHTLDHPFTSDDFNVIQKPRNQSDRLVIEALLIKHLKPELNLQLASDKLLIL